MPDIHRQQLPDPAAHHGNGVGGGHIGGIGLDGSAEEAMLQVGGLGHVGHHDHPLSLVVGKRLHGGGHQDDLGLQYHHHR